MKFILAAGSLLFVGSVFGASLLATAPQIEPAAAAAPTKLSVPTYGYEVMATTPHDPLAFTEGLLFLNGNFFESTGLNGESTLREVDPASGKILRQVTVPPTDFGEGLAVLGQRIFQLTWQSGKCFVYGLEDFRLTKELPFSGEGWGLTSDGAALIMSDGSDEIRFLDPDTFHVTRTIHVTSYGRPIKNLNELEFIKGEIYANIWQTNFVARIDPSNGNVVGVIDFHGLLKTEERTASTDVLNGIAYDEVHDRVFVTGKRWPKVFEVRLTPKPSASE